MIVARSIELLQAICPTCFSPEAGTAMKRHFLLIFLSWLLANLLGYGLGLGVALLLTAAFSLLPWVNQDRVLAPTGLLCIGLACGYAQSRTLRSLLPNLRRWMPATWIGYLLALLFILAVNLLRLGGQNDALLFAGIGAAIALPQWLLLRPHFRPAGLWVPAGALGFLAFLWLVANPASQIGAFLLAVALLGALAAVPSGLLLGWMVYRLRENFQARNNAV